MTTRALARNFNGDKIELIRPDAESRNSTLYDKFSHDFDKKTAKIRTYIIDINGLRILRVNLFRKFRKLLTIDFEFVNETINLDYLLSRLEIEADNQVIGRAEWPKNDIFLRFLQFKNLRVLKTEY